VEESPTAPVTFDPTVPIHHQVYLLTRHQITDGLWLGRNDFPGERELADQLGISVITTRAALDRLASDGWIERQRGRRPAVLYQPDQAKRPAPAAPRAIFETDEFRPFTYRPLTAGLAIVPAEACAAHERKPGERLWQCLRLRTYEGLPHSVAHNVQLPSIGERHTDADLSHQPMAKLLRDQGYEISCMRRRIGIDYAPAIVTEALQLTIAERVLIATFTLHGSDDKVLEWVRIYLHPSQHLPDEKMELATGTWSAAEHM